MDGLHFDWTISLGNIAQMVTVLVVSTAVWIAFKTRVELILKQQAELIASLRENFDKHEERDDTLFREMQSKITDLVGGVQRLIGQYEVFRSGHDRRQS